MVLDDNSVVVKDSQDDATEDPVVDDTSNAEEVLATDRKTVIDVLTGIDQKVWKITEAILTNSSGTLDISTNFNITDDEFIFSTSKFETSKTDFNGTLQWQQGNTVNTTGTTSEETLLDYYISPERYAFDFVGESSIDLESVEGYFSFKYIDQNTITGTISGEESATLAVTLAPKTNEDYIKIPNAALSFSKAFTYASNGVAGYAPGMIGSNSTNSVYIVTRESGMRGTADVRPERVTRFDFNNNTLTDQLFFETDFVSKQLHIIDNKLKVVGGQKINTYDLDLLSAPTTEPYGGQINLSRHGSAVKDDEIYIVGGSLASQGNQGGNDIGNEIYKWDDLNSSLNLIATMPEARSGARAEIIQNKLYIFGGTNEFTGESANNTIYIYDIETGVISTELLPTGLHFTYTGKQENLIFIGGQRISYTDDADGDGNPDGYLTKIDNEPYMGVYNTLNNKFTELATNLSSPELETIHSMAVINGKVYVLFGQYQEVAEGEYQNWDVLVADLN